MKKIIYIFVAMMTLGVSSCEDMLETESTRQVFDPTLDKMTDSLSYAVGIMNAMQQLADVYVLQNEARGDLATLTSKADTSLVALADYNDASIIKSRYDSAYVYYRVINNCNYYLAYRDSTLSEKGRNVVENEIAAVLAFRAWAYLQAVRQFGKVKFFLEPMKSISDIENAVNLPDYNLNQVVTALLADTKHPLERYSGLSVPNYGGDWNFGIPNYTSSSSATQNVVSQLCFIPLDIVIGDLYLERGNDKEDYLQAASHYWKFIYANSMYCPQQWNFTSFDRMAELEEQGIIVPDGFSYLSSVLASKHWSNIFSRNSKDQSVYTAPEYEVISYIPMAVNSLKGVTTGLPKIFGYDFYSNNIDSMNVGREIQMAPSAVHKSLSNSFDYYYADNNDATGRTVASLPAGDMRRYSMMISNPRDRESVDTCRYFTKYRYGRVFLYRAATVYMHLAEALNRMGYPDAAFAVLKDGLNYGTISWQENQELTAQRYLQMAEAETDQALIDDYKARAKEAVKNVYLREDTRNLLRTTLPFCSDENSTVFSLTNTGIHARGCSNSSLYAIYGNYSEYQYRNEVPRKMKQLSSTFNIDLSQLTTAEDSLKAEIDAVEDLLCDEYALEFTFEGSRFSDLTRMARHKNQSSPSIYGANYGSVWFDKKIKTNRPSVKKDLTVESNWYLPFQ